MKKVKSYNVETAKSRFILEIYQKPSGSYKAEYSGTTPKYAQVRQPGAPVAQMKEVGGGVLRGDDIEELFRRACAEIEKLDGKIDKCFELEPNKRSS